MCLWPAAQGENVFHERGMAPPKEVLHPRLQQEEKHFRYESVTHIDVFHHPHGCAGVDVPNDC